MTDVLIKQKGHTAAKGEMPHDDRDRDKRDAYRRSPGTPALLVTAGN